MATVKITNDNTDAIIRAKDAAVKIALEAIGLQAEKHAKLYVGGADGHPKRVYTGNLRNSITHQVKPDEEAVYVGTNVEYAPYVHEGTVKMSPNRFIRDAAEDHTAEYLAIAQRYLI